jgi:hypothetical protein
MSTEEKERNFVDKENFSQSWLVELNQKLTFCIHKIADKVDINEDDYELLQVLYKTYYDGEYLLYKTQVNMTEEKPVQNGLFDLQPTKATDIIDPHDDMAQVLTK